MAIEIYLFWMITVIISVFVSSFILFSMRKNIKTGMAIILPVFGVTYATYYYFGNSMQLSAYYSNDSKQQRKQQDGLRPIVTSIQKQLVYNQYKVQIQPDNLQAWWQLGQIYELQQNDIQAAVAYTAAYKLDPENMLLMSKMLSSNTKLNNGILSKDALKLTLRLLNSDYRSTALNLLAVSGFQTGKFSEAVDYWQKLLQELPNDDVGKNTASAITEMIVKAKKYQELPNLHVLVKLASGLSSKSDNQVFITAKATDGTRMPLAVVKRTVADLPAKVTLGLHNSMTDTWNILSVDEIQVEARIASNNDAIAVSGDILGKSEIIKINNKNRIIEVTMDQILP